LLMVRDARLDRLNRYGTEVPPALRKILDRMLARDPAARFPTAGTLRDVLQDYLFQSRQRVNAGDLGLFLESLRQKTPFPDQPAPMEDPAGILVGEDTNAQQKEAERNRQALRDASRQPSVVARAAEIEESSPFIEDA